VRAPKEWVVTNMSMDYDRPRYNQPSPLWWLPVLLLIVVIGGLVWWFWPSRDSGQNPQAEPRPVTARGDLSELEKANIAIYERASLSLAQVTNLARRTGFLTFNVQEIPKGVGSGFVWDDEGHIVTNYHVVEGADAAQVTLSDPKSSNQRPSYQAHQLWADPDHDIAVLWIQVPKGKLQPIQLGSSHDLKVGQITYALGDPFGLDQTMTTGIVSALDRTIDSANNRPIHGVIQTSAAINPGNSGGPLLDSAGRLIGMNTAILSPSGSFAGIGFAIPVDEINRIVPQLIRHGKVVRPRLGVQVVQDQIARKLGVDHGALILKVVPGSAAAQAGLRGTSRDEDTGNIKLGDVIVAVDGKAINNAADLNAALDRHQVGDTLTVTIERDGKRQDVKVTLTGMA
jgi:S1-C subfamily serine protease